jgi:hypothetical protein
MRARSWTAALALIVGSLIALTTESSAQDRTPASSPPRAAKLSLVIAGLGRDGCDVEIKPGNPSCKFRALNENGKESRQHVGSSGKATLDLRDIELRGADRTCSIAITVHEPGQPSKTIYRGFRLTGRSEASGTPNAKIPPIPTFTCWLSSTMKPTRLAVPDVNSSTRK